MLVITYTSEHNHPWPTQRNALAGSTRSQPTKSPSTTTTTFNKLSYNTTTPTSISLTTNHQKQPHYINIHDDHHYSMLKEDQLNHDQHNNINGGGHFNIHVIKEESSINNFNGTHDQGLISDQKTDDHDHEITGYCGYHSIQHDQLHDHQHHSDDFFSELGELEPNPLNLIFPTHDHFNEEKSSDHEDEAAADDDIDNHKPAGDADPDPFSYFNWASADQYQNLPTKKGL